MAWIRVETSLPGHPKVRKLARHLGKDCAHVVGLLISLWSWVLDYYEDGDISTADLEDIAIGARWEGDAEEFFDALISCRLIVDGKISGWDEYQGHLISRREKDRAKARAQRAKNRTKRDSPRTIPKQSGESPGTIPGQSRATDETNGQTNNQTFSVHGGAANDKNPFPIRPESGADRAAIREFAVATGFLEWWEHYERKENKFEAEKAWTFDLGAADYPLMVERLEKWHKTMYENNRGRDFCPDTPLGATWIRGLRWEDE